MLFGCNKRISEPPVEETSPITEDIVSHEDKADETTEPEDPIDIFQQQRKSEEGIAFYDTEKEPWGEKDFHIYDYKGEVIKSPKTVEEEPEGGKRGVRLCESELTYRGIAIGDDAYEALLHMNLPKETVIPWGEGIREYAVLYDFNKLSSYTHPSGISLISICFDEDFQVLEVLDVYPYISKIGVVWEVIIEIRDDKINNFYASGKSCFIKDDTNS